MRIWVCSHCESRRGATHVKVEGGYEWGCSECKRSGPAKLVEAGERALYIWGEKRK